MILASLDSIIPVSLFLEQLNYFPVEKMFDSLMLQRWMPWTYFYLNGVPNAMDRFLSQWRPNYLGQVAHFAKFNSDSFLIYQQWMISTYVISKSMCRSAGIRLGSVRCLVGGPIARTLVKRFFLPSRTLSIMQHWLHECGCHHCNKIDSLILCLGVQKGS